MDKIGILGLAGAGKDTFAQLLNMHLCALGCTKFNITRYAVLLKLGAQMVFGDTFDNRDVKEVAIELTPSIRAAIYASTDVIGATLHFDGKTFDTWRKLINEGFMDENTISPRSYQVIVGTAGRTLRPTLWVDYIKYDKTPSIVADVRFPNEMLDYNILVINPEVTNAVKTLHKSEVYAYELSTDIAPYHEVDAVVYNSGTIQELNVVAFGLAEQLIKRM